jgi:hypothetical protein
MIMYEQNPFLVVIGMFINGYVILVVILVFARLMCNKKEIDATILSIL